MKISAEKMNNETMVDAEVTISFIVSDVCTLKELDDTSCFTDMVLDKIDAEGLYSLIEYDEDGYIITNIQPIH